MRKKPPQGVTPAVASEKGGTRGYGVVDPAWVVSTSPTLGEITLEFVSLPDSKFVNVRQPMKSMERISTHTAKQVVRDPVREVRLGRKEDLSL